MSNFTEKRKDPRRPANEELFVRPDGEIGLFYSLSNCAGTLRREGVNAHAYHAAARLLEDAHRSYEVIFVQRLIDIGS